MPQIQTRTPDFLSSSPWPRAPTVTWRSANEADGVLRAPQRAR